ncbi:hypothetical protein [Nocardia sp. NPDC046763]|uniref:hypothetical protein n=1 Tax=Nocardia sp. NPDC046763 TaxID=3155256 RepID=UPI00340ABC08
MAAAAPRGPSRWATDLPGLLRARHNTEQVRAQAFSTAAELGYLAGFKAHDCGGHAIAQRYYLRAPEGSGVGEGQGFESYAVDCAMADSHPLRSPAEFDFPRIDLIYSDLLARAAGGAAGLFGTGPRTRRKRAWRRGQFPSPRSLDIPIVRRTGFVAEN